MMHKTMIFERVDVKIIEDALFEYCTQMPFVSLDVTFSSVSAPFDAQHHAAPS